MAHRTGRVLLGRLEMVSAGAWGPKGPSDDRQWFVCYRCLGRLTLRSMHDREAGLRFFRPHYYCERCGRWVS